MKRAICQLCGKVFTPNQINMKYCSKECSKIGFVLKARQYRKKKAQLKNKVRPKSTLDKNINAALADGITYGYYVARKYMEEQKSHG